VVVSIDPDTRACTPPASLPGAPAQAGEAAASAARAASPASGRARSESQLHTLPAGSMLELEEVSLTQNGGSSAGGVAGGKPMSRWARWAAGGRATLSKLGAKGLGARGSAGPMAARDTASLEEVPEHWGLTAREMGTMDKRWQSWSAAVRAVRPSPDSVGDVETNSWDSLSLAPALVGALKRRGIFYGWVVLAMAVLATALESPLGEVTLAVALGPVAASLGVTQPAVGRALSYALLVSAPLSPACAIASSHLPPGAAAALCAMVLSLGLVLVSKAGSLGLLGLGVAIGKTAGHGVLQPLATSVLHSWWRSRRRAVDTVANVALALVVVGLTPALVHARASAGDGAEGAWRAAFSAAAAAALFLGIPALLLLLPRTPNTYGLMPDGEAAAAAFQGDEALEITDLPAQMWSFGDAAKTRKFWVAMLALITVRVHAAGMLFLHPRLLPEEVTEVEWLVAVACGGAVSATGIGLGLDTLQRKHAVLSVALMGDAVALYLASGRSEGGGEIVTRLWGALAGGMLSASALIPGPLWCQLFGSVDALRIAQLSATLTIAATGVAIGLWTWWHDTFGSIEVAFKLASFVAAAVAVVVTVVLHDEVDGTVQSWQSLRANRPFKISLFGRNSRFAKL